jgi:hypothetical protein
MTPSRLLTLLAAFGALLFLGFVDLIWAQGETMMFSVVADVPYSTNELVTLQRHVDNHNLYSPALFLMHLGDIKSGSGGCSESTYSGTANILEDSAVPVYVVIGDNEWSDCSNRDQAFAWWNEYFLRFEDNFCGTPNTDHQSVRQENFAFLSKGVLFIGVNLPNGSESGYQTRLQQDADWVTQKFQQYGSQARGAVVVGHAGPGGSRNAFFDPFRQAAASFGKPVLYIHGDGHKWISDSPWPENNMSRVQLDRGDKPPVLVTVSTNPGNMFSFNRTPWDANSQPYNRPPCGGSETAPNIVVNPSSFNFGDVEVGLSDSQTIVVSNNGNESLQVTGTSITGGDASHFNIDSGGGAFSLAPGAERNVVVSFNPTSEGSKSTTLRFQNNDPNDNPKDVPLLGNGSIPTPTGPVATIIHDAYVRSTEPTTNFGANNTIRVKLSSPNMNGYLKFNVTGMEGTAQLAKLRLYVSSASPSGGSVYLVSNNLEGSSTPWTESAIVFNNAPSMNGSPLSSLGAVSSGQWVEFDVTPVIVANGTYSFGIKNNSSTAVQYHSKEGANDPQLVITGGGGPPQPPAIASFSPTSGGPGTQVTVLGNHLFGATEVAFNGVASSNFSVVSNGEIHAEVPGTASSGKIRVTTAVGSTSSSADFTVIQPQPDIAVNPTSHGFGAVSVTTSATETFVVSNTGSFTLNVTSTALTGTNASEFNIDSGGGAFSLAPGNQRDVDVRFSPTSEGAKSASLSFSSNDPDENPFAVSLSGSGVPAQPDIAVSPSSHDFGSVTTNAGGESQVFVVSNSGLLDLNVTATSLVGTNASEFRIDSGGGAFVLTPGVNRNVQVTLDPTSEGSKTATLRFESNDPDENPLNISLTGTGALPGTGPQVFTTIADAYVSSSQTTNNFGSSNTLRVRNASTVLVSYLKFTVSGISGSAQDAKLRLFVTQSNQGGSAYLVSNDYNDSSDPWAESGLNWSNAPAIGGGALSTLGTVPAGQWVEFDVTPAVTGNGTFSFAIKSTSSSAVFYSSKEGTNVPELVVVGGGTPPQPPAISSFDPGSGLAGVEVTIAGSHLSGASQVTFNNVPASSFSVESGSEVRATVPASATTGKVRVTTIGGTAASSSDFTVIPPPAPTISSFTPASGLVGSIVTISGSDLASAIAVAFNGTVSGSFTVVSNNQIHAEVPNGANAGKISVTTAGGEALSADDFTVSAPPPITLFNPTDDAYVRLASPTATTPTATTLRVRKTSSETIVSYLKFDLTTVSSAIQSATLRLFVTDASSDGGELFLVSNDYQGVSTPWLQSGLNWNNAPVIDSAPIAAIGPVSLSNWVELDVSSVVSGSGVFSFAIRNNSSDVAYYSSREAPNKPELVIELASGLQAAKFIEGALSERDLAGVLPERVELEANYPNPFNLETVIPYTLPENGKIQLRVYNIRGQLVRTLVNGFEEAGFKRARWNGRDDDGIEVGSGIYFVRLEVGPQILVHRITLQK